MPSRELRVAIIGDAKSLQAATARTTASLSTLDKRVQSSSRRLTSTGSMLTRHLTLPIGLAGLASAKMAVDFQRSMELVRTQAGASQGEVDRMSQAVLKLAPATATGPQALSDALYHIESVGLRGARALDVLKTAALGAKVGNADLEATTNALASATVSHIKGVQNETRAMAVLNAIVGAGNMRMDDLASSMSSGILPVARTFGLSLQDVGAAMATLTDNGVPAQEAATRLRMTFSLLGAPTKKAAGALKSIGINQLQLAQDMRGPNGLVHALTDLHNHLEGMSKSKQAELLAEAFGGGRSSGTIMTLLGNLGRLKDKYTQIGGAVGKYASAVTATQHTQSYQVQRDLAELEVSGIRAGQILLPVFTSIAGGASGLVGSFSDLPKTGQEMVVMGALGVAALGPLLSVIGNVEKAYLGLKAATMEMIGADTLLEAAMTPMGAGLIAVGLGLAAYELYAGQSDWKNQALANSYQRAASAVDGMHAALDRLTGTRRGLKLLHAQQAENLVQLKGAAKVYTKTVEQDGKNSKAAIAAEYNLELAKQSVWETGAKLSQQTKKATAEQADINRRYKEGTRAVMQLTVAAKQGVGQTRYSTTNTDELGRSVKQLITDEDNLAGKFGKQAAAAAKSNPILSANYSRLQAEAHAAAEVAQNINAIPTYKEIHIQMLIDQETLKTTVKGNQRGGGASTKGGPTASGGPVHPGKVYSVGEHGPESLVMGRGGGYVIPDGGRAAGWHGGGSGGGTTIINVRGNILTERQLFRSQRRIGIRESRRGLGGRQGLWQGRG